MSILIVNDDGIQSEGILELAYYLKADNKVVVCAPEKNWSYSSHFMTTDGELAANRVELDGLRGVECWSVSGSPADCVSLAINKLLITKPEAVISGINRGENLGMADILSSGTFNAAACARRQGIPAAAISLARISDDFSKDYSHAARFAVQICNTLLSGAIPPDIVLNVNVPGLDDCPSGVKITEVGDSTYKEVYTPIEPDGQIYKQDWIDDGSTQPRAGTDTYWNERGYITVSPVRLPSSDKEMMDTLLGLDFSI